MTPARSRGAAWLLLFCVLGFAALMGAVAGLGRPMLLGPFIALLGLVVLFVVPARLMFWSLLLLSMLVVGPVMYFAKIESARWGPPLLAMALYVPLVAYVLKPRRSQPDAGWPLWLFVLFMFIATAVFSTVMGSPMLGEVVVASRAYLAFWSFALALALGMFAVRDMLLGWWALLACAAIQLPVSMYQYFVVAKQSMRLSPWDAVVGTFPGNMDGGGASHAMGIFLLIALCAVVALWRARRIHRGLAVVIGACILGSLVLSEVKAVVLLVPVAFALQFWRELVRRPLLAVGAVVVSVGLMASIMTLYQTTFYAGRGVTLQGKLPSSPLESIQNQLNPQQAHTKDGGQIVSRAARVADWWRRGVTYGDPYHALLGYGVGATQNSSFGMGELVPKFAYLLDTTGTNILLWETGVIGHLLLVLLLLLAAANANACSRSPLVPVEHRALLEAGGVGLVLFAITLPYSNFALRTPPSQFLMVFMLGYATYWWRQVRLAQPAHAMGRFNAAADATRAPPPARGGSGTRPAAGTVLPAGYRHG
ncbi:hypothetical protein [Azohydromonas aeria]|uniref:hypothetical protein n=1 Tax=Azohydromonas aeria TaxID=2590212 RepID=UPI0012FC09F6|nr:hypothetical protein [Azohydromonas aeria]